MKHNLRLLPDRVRVKDNDSLKLSRPACWGREMDGDFLDFSRRKFHGQFIRDKAAAGGMTAQYLDGISGEVAEANPDGDMLARFENPNRNPSRLYIENATLKRGDERAN